jgi:hypothetical protein
MSRHAAPIQKENSVNPAQRTTPAAQTGSGLRGGGTRSKLCTIDNRKRVSGTISVVWNRDRTGFSSKLRNVYLACMPFGPAVMAAHRVPWTGAISIHRT